MTETEMEPVTEGDADQLKPGFFLDERGRVCATPETKEAIRLASIAGCSDNELEERFGVAGNTIRQWRFKDAAWQELFNLKPRAYGANYGKNNGAVTNGAEIAQKAASSVQEAIASGKVANELLLLQIASKGLKQADGKMPEVKSWGDVKAIADIVAKIGPQAQAAVQVNVLTDGQTQFAAFEFPNFDSEAIEIEEME
jgi:hypothetical protein